MANFSRQYLFRIIGASLGAFLHLFVVATVVFAGGEGPAFTLLYMDFPIVYLWQSFIGPAGVGGGPLLFLCFLGGTLMYALVGWVVGGLGDWLVRKLNK
jgi:hypothetical protein